MLRAMDSAVAGLRAHQNKMDVVGHNIANVNTYGFKAQTYTFKEAMYQTSTASTGNNGNAGGVNAAQYGYGTLMGTIGMDMTASTPTYVGGFNASIDGEGFFITSSSLQDKIDDISAKDITTVNYDYTRVGQFTVDSSGYIVDGNGNFVYGFNVDDKGQNQSTNLGPLRVPKSVLQNSDGSYKVEFSENVGDGEAMEALDVQINKMGDIQVSLKIQYGTGKDADGNDPTTSGKPEVMAEKVATVTIGQVAIATFQNEEGLTKDGNGYYVSTPSDNTGTCSAGAPGEGRSTLMPGYLEASNVDMATEFAEMIMTQRGFQANSKIITVSDEILNDLINMKR